MDKSIVLLLYYQRIFRAVLRDCLFEMKMSGYKDKEPFYTHIQAHQHKLALFPYHGSRMIVPLLHTILTQTN